MPDHLVDHPELAMVALLQEALHLGCSALTAAHADLMSGSGFDDEPPAEPAVWIALDAIHLITALGHVLESYRHSLRAARHAARPDGGARF